MDATAALAPLPQRRSDAAGPRPVTLFGVRVTDADRAAAGVIAVVTADQHDRGGHRHPLDHAVEQIRWVLEHPEDQEEPARADLAYLPDHEPGLGQALATSNPRWISGRTLARDASILLHDGQYADDEYPARRGWGHSRLSDTLTFARRSEAQRLLLFHHDPEHDRYHDGTDH